MAEPRPFGLWLERLLITYGRAFYDDGGATPSNADAIRLLNCRGLENGKFSDGFESWLKKHYPTIPVTVQED